MPPHFTSWARVLSYMDTKGAKVDFLKKPWPFGREQWDSLTDAQRQVLLKREGLEWLSEPVEGESDETIQKMESIFTWVYQYNQSKDVLEFLGQKPEKIRPDDMDIDLYRILHIYHELTKIAQYDARCGKKKEPEESKTLMDMRKKLQDTVVWWDYSDTLERLKWAFLKKEGSWQMKINL